MSITLIKRIIVFTVALGTAGVALAFSLISGHELSPDPSPRSLLEAYAMAMQALGSATNEYYCVAVKRSHDWCHAGEWVLTFDKNSVQHKLVFVAMKPFESVSPNYHLKPWPLTEVRDTGWILNSTNGAASK